MESACQNDEAEKAFTEYAHDKNFSITYIVQSGFCHGKKGRNIINLDTKCKVLLKTSMG